MHNISPDIIVNQSNTHEPGTFTKLYCSDTRSVNDILKQVINGLQPAQPRFYPEFSTIEYTTNNCLININSNAKKGIMSKGVPVSMEKISGQGMCSDSSIVYLVTQGLINLKKYHNTGQSDVSVSKSASVVIADYPIPMRNVIHDGYFFPAQIHKPKNQALGWFQGDLHVFELDQELKHWNILTSIYPQDNNGILIINFLFEFMEEFVLLKDQLESFKNPNRNSYTSSSSSYRRRRKITRDQFRSIYSSFSFPPFASKDQTNFLDLTKFYDMKNINPYADNPSTRSTKFFKPDMDKIFLG
ncbi:BgtAc-31366 [Blumeria graminis f. sp. tritici]|uniref:BgtAc-31366 n=2 Tax=Blumeria graminis f. sp. tritici TaxID=62690 RepID=A0A9X9PRX2_BLUGR|nr:hypothetical protein BGT96224_Ac31366 [Blumeria graminis f. sp. tritici 96224]VCU40464.1 BgtAc-31366 [Blumeria graminis f. sp. tritici]